MMNHLNSILLLFFALVSFAMGRPCFGQTIMETGPYRGQIINGGERENIKIISETPSGFLISGVWAQNKFWDAEIPFAVLQKVTLELEHFNGGPVPAGHTMLRFSFSSPITLTHDEQKLTTSDLIFSVEAVPFNGESYGLVTGMLNHFAISYRVINLEDKAKVIVDERHHRVDQMNLKLTFAERAAVLREALRMSNDTSMAGPYNTIRRSCTTELFRVLDNSLHYDFVQRLMNVITKVGAIYPNFAAMALMSRGIYNGRGPDLAADRCHSSLGNLGLH